MIHHQGRVSIIGAGTLGGTIAYSLLLTNIAKEILLIDLSENIVQGQALDLQEAISLGSDLHQRPATTSVEDIHHINEDNIPTIAATSIRAGTFKEAGQSTLVIFTADITEPNIPCPSSFSSSPSSSPSLDKKEEDEKKQQQQQQEWLCKSRELLLSVASCMSPVHPDILILVTSNPVDLYVQSLQSYFPHVNPKRIFGVGHSTFATRRFRRWLIDQQRILQQSESQEQPVLLQRPKDTLRSSSSVPTQTSGDTTDLHDKNNSHRDRIVNPQEPLEAADDIPEDVRVLLSNDSDVTDAYVLGSRLQPFLLWNHAKIKGVPLPAIQALNYPQSSAYTMAQSLTSIHRWKLICRRKGQAAFTMAAIVTRLTHDLLFHMPFNRSRQNSIASTLSLTLTSSAAATRAMTRPSSMNITASTPATSSSSTANSFEKQQEKQKTQKRLQTALAKANESRYWVLSVYVPKYDCCMSWPVYVGASGIEKWVDVQLTKEENEQVVKVVEVNWKEFQMSFGEETY
ncbi:hypothetical protein BDF20DRAFT_912352 [Mycotypha africana]|uniref:uncharacterized protein n=1 Tax=Mycotypha africana TaxID=64632 RepID=UPI0022FFCCF2|nr:uncharacterized protein BDF20DRAFT_912352 [Mycotypha africana]KAI8982151.1 hypothetical protein BDF20DRAFT_912352 [Mycotypha africana]